MIAPRFSVVIPLHDKAPYVVETIDSALAQTLAPVEVIVVDDGSTDGGADLVKARFGPRIKLVRQANAGPGPARNRGAAEARGEWIAFLDADDLWAPDHLATLAEVAAAFPGAALIAAAHCRFHAGEPLPEDFPPTAPRPIDYWREAIGGEPLSASSVAIRRDVLRGSGGFGAFCPGEDMDLWVRLALDHDFAGSDRVTAFYRQGTGGQMDQLSAPASDLAHQPVFATIERALADPAQAPRHAAIRALRDHWRLSAIKQQLYRADPRAARVLIAEARKGATSIPGRYRLLATLPEPVLAAAMRGWRGLRRIRASSALQRFSTSQ